ncbi:MAG: caspase family protein [Kouleothrix sp.]|nr:caspase family protein [Kouleothrix sp.]
MTERTEPSAQPRERGVVPVARPTYAAHANRWAIIVGVSSYQYEGLTNLQYAHRDAEELYDLLQTPAGGGFERERIRKLIDAEATTANITRALRSFLKQPAKEDIVLIYFACHGAPDLDRPSLIYLITYDTDPSDISGTALPMREIDLSLQENLLAERVVIIADTCHSAALGGRIGRRGAGNEAQAINAYLEQVSKAKGGVALLTSAEASESAQEGEQWGGGHGVFTHFLLQGMRGDADGYGEPKDGVVTVGELFDYVRDSVKRATGDRQHPAIGTNPFDRSLPMAISGGVNAQEHYRLGCQLYDLGRRLDDIRRFRAAVAQFDEAIRLAKMAQTPLPEAQLGLGKALLAAGDPEAAARELARLVEQPEGGDQPEALLYLGVAQAKQHDLTTAMETFRQYLAQAPHAEEAAWVEAYLARPLSPDGGRRLALQLGINRYSSSSLPALRGCVNDIEMMLDTLVSRYGFSRADSVLLRDEHATRQNILASFADLSAGASATDIVVVHYSGHSIPESRRESYEAVFGHETYLIAHDTAEGLAGISARELHALMNGIPAEHKTLILDTHPSATFNELAEREGTYALLLASDSAEIAYEHTFELGGRQVTAGLFSGALNRQLSAADPDTVTYGQLIDGVLDTIKTLGYDQTPLLIGDREQPIFAAEDVYLRLFDFAQRRHYPELSSQSLAARYARLCKRLAAPFPQAHYSFGRAFLERGEHARAIDALRTALDQRGGDDPEMLLALGRAQLGAQQYANAAGTFRRYAAVAPAEAPPAQALVERIDKLTQGRRHALVVGIDDYTGAGLPRLRGAANDARLMRDTLVSTLGFPAGQITMLINRDATCDAIRERFQLLAAAAREEPALFYFAGYGSLDPEGQPTLVSADGRQGQIFDITLDELRELAGGRPANLVTIMDAGWTRCSQASDSAAAGSRTAPDDTRVRPIKRNLGAAREIDRDGAQFVLGAVSIYSGSLAVSFTTSPLKIEARYTKPRPGGRPAYHGALTYGLVDALAQTEPAGLTYTRWVEAAELRGAAAPVVQGTGRDEPLFRPRSLLDGALAQAIAIERQPIVATIGLLRRLIEQREQHGDLAPEARLNLGIAYAAIGEYEKSVDALERAIALYSDPNIMAREREKDPAADDHAHEAHYQLGRALFESERDFTRAVAELNEATRLDPANTAAYLYLGLAIRAMVERETLAKAEQALQTYLARGAPLGREDQVRQFLGSRGKAAAKAV